ncbi:polymeric immunoglobulin receptor-like isoform X2 [Hemitrygon akajei]|uniref:polymeric immunoglobulin receptor-like isoform X2 n=1 Tax=Hemitrygon akajei TaxID=2704970 RepID=UPI003BF9DEDF
MFCISRLLLNMKFIQLMFTFISISLAAEITGPKQVFGTVGEAVTIRCQYKAYYKHHRKYLCKGSSWRSCRVIAHSGSQQDGTDRRTTIVDNQTSTEFSITMTQLTIEDTGHYWCGITYFGFDKMAEIHLNITEAEITGPKQVFGTVGEAVTIRCQYNAYYKHHRKYLCKGSSWRSCSVIAHSGSQQDGTDRRITIVDNQTSTEFSITMTQLTIEDTGHYWCGITSDSFDKMAEIHLNITEVLTTPSPTPPDELWKTSQSTTNLSIFLGIIFGVTIIAAVFFIRLRKYSAVACLGEKGFRYIGEESNSVTTSGDKKEEGLYVFLGSQEAQ